MLRYVKNGRVTAVFVAVCVMLAALVPAFTFSASGASAEMEEAEDYDWLFFDDFEGDKTLSQRGWTGVADGSPSVKLQGGVANHDTDGNHQAKVSLDMMNGINDYVVEADITPGTDPITSGTGIAMLVARSKEGAERGGIEFGIQFKGTDDHYGEYAARVYNLDNKKQMYYWNQDALNALGVTLAKGTKCHVKVTVTGSAAYFFINGVKVYDSTVDADKSITMSGSGLPGFNSMNMNAAFDNFTVRPVHDPEDLNDYDASGSGVMFYDGFHPNGQSDPDDRGWTLGSGTNAEADGKLEVAREGSPGSGSRVNIDGATAWTDYVVEAKVQMDSGGFLAGGPNSMVGAVTVRGNADGNGIEFGLQFNKGSTDIAAARIYDRINGKSLWNPSAAELQTLGIDTAVQRGKWHTLKAVVRGGRLICSIDGITVYDGEPDGMAESGTAGVMSVSAPSYFDSFTVREIAEGDVPSEPSAFPEGVWFRDTFDAAPDYTNFWVAAHQDKVTVSGGVAKLESLGTELDMHLDSNATKTANPDGEQPKDWTDYTVEAKIKLPAEGQPSPSTSFFAGIVARRDDINDGGRQLEFELLFTGSGSSVRLIERYVMGERSGTGIAVEGTFIKGGTDGSTDGISCELKPGEEYTLAMSVRGNHVVCRLNDEIVIEALLNDRAPQKGTVATRVKNCVAEYGEFTVRGIKDGDIPESPSQLPEGVWFFDNFENAVDYTDTWTVGGDHTDRFTATAEGKGRLDGNDKVQYESHLKPDTEKWKDPDGKQPKEWTDYVVETKLTVPSVGLPGLDTESGEGKTTTRFAAVVARRDDATTSGGRQIELDVLIDYSGKSRIRLGERYISGEKAATFVSLTAGNNAEFKTGSAEVGYEFAYDTEYSFKMVLKGNRVICSVNGAVIIDCELIGDGHPARGTVGVRESWCAVEYDDFTVRSINEDTDIPADAPQPPAEVTPKPEGALFFEPFDETSGMPDRGWNLEQKVVDGKGWIDNYGDTAKAGVYVTEFPGAYDWDNYSVEAEVTVPVDPPTGDIDFKSFVIGIGGRASAVGKGYEFGLEFAGCKAEENIARLRFYNRTTGSDMLYCNDYLVERGETYTLKMVFFENRVICYFNGDAVIDWVDKADSNPKGTAFLKITTPTVPGIYDNVTVMPVDGSDLPEPPADEKYAPDYYDDFEGDSLLTERGWSSDSPDIDNGRLHLDIDRTQGLTLNGYSGSDVWTDYVVETKVTLGADIDWSTGAANSMGTSVGARADVNGNGYEFGIFIEKTGGTFVRVYNRRDGKAIAGPISCPGISAGGTYVMKMVVSGNRIVCFLNGKKVIDITDGAISSGTAHLRSTLSAYYDYAWVHPVRESDFLEYEVNVEQPGTAPGDGGGSVSPQTGDGSRFAAAVAVFAASILLCGAMAIIGGKRERRGE